MATTNTNKKILDVKRWELMSFAPASAAAGVFIASSRHYRQQQLYVTGANTTYIYNPLEDGFVQIPNAGLAGTFGAGACGVATAIGPSGTATAGTTTTLTTNLTLTRDLRGYSIHITGGPGAGDVREIASNTVGANSVITVTSPFSATITTSSTYRLITPRWYVLCAGTLASASFRYYDFATNTWTTVSQTGLPATVGTDSKLISTPSWMDTSFLSFSTGTSSGTNTTTTLNDTTKNWTVNQWTNSQIRITAGTGAGQIRTISSNTATAITVSATWTTTPDNTSQYSIEGNDDFLYYMGSGAVTLYRYSISANTWTTLSPATARTTAPSTGMSGHWIWGVTDSAWTNENAIQNGRYIYSFRGGNSSGLDRYDIAGNTWLNTVSYAPAIETFTTGTKYAYNGNFLYIQKESTGRWLRHDFVTSETVGWSFMLYPNGTANLGDTAFDVTYTDGATKITYIYMILNNSTAMLRQMVI